MRRLVNLGHLTGSGKVLDVGLFTTSVTPRTRRDIGHIFFQPYESKNEFKFCAQRTAIPAFMLLMGPAVILSTIDLLSAITVAILVSDLLARSYHGGDLPVSEDNTNAVNYIVADMCQAILDLLVFPLAVIVMMTRGISTGLKAAGIYDYDAPALQATGLTA